MVVQLLAAGHFSQMSSQKLAHAHVSMRACVYVCVCVCVYVCMCVCLYVCLCVCFTFVCVRCYICINLYLYMFIYCICSCKSVSGFEFVQVPPIGVLTTYPAAGDVALSLFCVLPTMGFNSRPTSSQSNAAVQRRVALVSCMDKVGLLKYQNM